MRSTRRLPKPLLETRTKRANGETRRRSGTRAVGNLARQRHRQRRCVAACLRLTNLREQLCGRRVTARIASPAADAPERGVIRRASLLVANVDPRAALGEERDDVVPSPRRGAVQRRLPGAPAAAAAAVAGPADRRRLRI